MSAAFRNYFDDFDKDQIINHSVEKTISEGEHQLFTLLTLNHHLSHISTPAAGKTEFRKKLVNGTYVFSVVVGLSVPDLSFNAIANLGYSEIQHLHPVFEGDTLRATTRVIGKRLSKTRANTGIIEFETSGWVGRTKVISLKRSILISKK